MKFHLVAHTHWDREWHKTRQEYRVMLIDFMDDLIGALKNDASYTSFMLDGQTIMIDDYLEIKPEQKGELARLVREGRIIAGPWYVQPDVNIPCGESLIRNLLIGRKMCKPYGKCMQVGYLPDSFGLSSTIVQVLKGFGIDSIVFYRGLYEKDTPYNEFVWRGIDGSSVLAIWMPIGYGNGMFLTSDLEKSMEILADNLNSMSSRTSGNNLLIMCGSDQCFTKKFLPGLCNELNKLQDGNLYKLSSLEEYIADVKAKKNQLTEVVGYLRYGKTSRTHISIGATRLDITRRNFDIERKYTRILEPLCALVALHTGKYPAAMLDYGWKLITMNHAHDSICCVCTDAVHREMLMRMEHAGQVADTLIKDKASELFGMIKFNKNLGKPFIIFNSSLGNRSQVINADVFVKQGEFALLDSSGREIPYNILSTEKINLKDYRVVFGENPDDLYDKVTIQFPANIRGYGYTTYYVREGVAPGKDINIPGVKCSGNSMENDFVKVTVTENGTLEIEDKVNMKKYKGLHYFRDNGNAGDEYDYSPPYNDAEITTLGSRPTVKIKEKEITSMHATMEVDYVIDIPADCDNQARSKEFAKLPITTEISLDSESKLVRFKTKIRNNARNHRLQAVFDLRELCARQFADTQFGTMYRQDRPGVDRESEQGGWHERHYPIYSQQRYCGVLGPSGHGFVMFNKGLPQYEVLQDSTTRLCLTVLNSVSNMGNENLKYRPGRRSGAKCSTPDSMMLGDFEVEYAFLPVSETEDYNTYADFYANPVVVFSFPEVEYKGVLPDSRCYISCEDGLIVSAIKQREDGNGFILRVYNPYPFDILYARMEFNGAVFKKPYAVDLKEEPVGGLVIRTAGEKTGNGINCSGFDGTVMLPLIRHNSIITLSTESLESNRI